MKFAVSSTSTPAVAQGKAVVCGSDSAKYPVNGTVSVIDVATMTLESSVVAGSGQSQSSPLISVQGDGVYAYFTCNSNPGGVYSYKLGDDKAYQLFVPEKGMQNFCAASVVADAAGNLYYTNDSGTLFKLSAAPSFAVVFETNGGSAMSALRVAQNKPMGKPIDPVREGHLFMGWFADEQLTQPWDFSAPVAGDMTLYAKWGEDVNAGGDVKPPIDPDELRPSAPEGGISPSNPSVTVVPTYTVVTTRTPLADVKQDAAASAAPDGKAAPVASGGSGSYAAAREAPRAPSPQRPKSRRRRSTRSPSRASRSASSSCSASRCISHSRVVARRIGGLSWLTKAKTTWRSSAQVRLLPKSAGGRTYRPGAPVAGPSGKKPLSQGQRVGLAVVALAAVVLIAVSALFCSRPAAREVRRAFFRRRLPRRARRALRPRRHRLPRRPRRLPTARRMGRRVPRTGIFRVKPARSERNGDGRDARSGRAVGGNARACSRSATW